ncbi:TPA: copper chaperone PCu(A)C [Photobacterium damselae]
MKQLVAFFLMLLSSSTWSSQAEHIFVENAWMPIAPTNSTVRAVYLSIQNNSDHLAKLTKVHSPNSQAIELHTHQHQDGMMKMRKLDYITIPANGKIPLKPHGDHLMLFDFHTTDNFPITLEFADGSHITTTVKQTK